MQTDRKDGEAGGRQAQWDRETEDRANLADARQNGEVGGRCPRHPQHVVSTGGGTPMFDAPCPACEGNDDEYDPEPDHSIPDTSCQACGSPECGGCYSDADSGL